MNTEVSEGFYVFLFKYQVFRSLRVSKSFFQNLCSSIHNAISAMNHNYSKVQSEYKSASTCG